MRSPSLRGAVLLVAACLAGSLLTLPSIAGADSKYPTGAAARGFNGGLAGWTDNSTVEGTCLSPLICPGIENTFEANGGADGGGFIRSTYTGVVGAMAVGGTTTAVWTSPTFTYEGDGGDEPDTVVFEMDRRASVDQLLAVSGNSATYSVRLVDMSDGGKAISLIGPSTLAGANDWRSVATDPIDSNRLVIEDDYQLLITSTYVTGTSVLVSGSADYDNVTLRTLAGQAGKGGKGKGKGGQHAARSRCARASGS